MHVSGLPLLPSDLYPLLQFLLTLAVIALALLHLLKSTASKYFVVDATFDDTPLPATPMGAVPDAAATCAVCGIRASKNCSRCKRVRYCSTTCQREHWTAGHKKECGLKSSSGQNATISGYGDGYGSKHSKGFPQLEKVLFPYEDFVKLFNWENMKLSPCGLLNCGNSCYANVVLQCLSSTRPLVAYLLEVRHARKCRRNDWCFLCELEAHVDRATHSCQPFSPINILSRLPNIGGNLGYGKQEDAHEFMRFAIDTMQSVCLDEFGGEKAIHPSSQETTLVQYIFGGHLQSQVKCSKCQKISDRHENMMDLTVEIQGDAESLEKCLDQFTAEEWLDGENMYKCDGCNDYVKACKRLAIHQAPNILTIALKRFQSGRFGKLNKRVTFPETLDLSPYMSEPGCGSDIYRLYAVVVHIDMLNASYFGHYICYVKDFCGHWYRIDDCKVETVELEEVLSQGAYMLLYSRISARPSSVKPPQIRKVENPQVVDMVEEAQPRTTAVGSVAISGAADSPSTVGIIPTDMGSLVGVKQQPEENVSEETQPCLPVFESINVNGSVSSVSTMTTDARFPTKISTSENFDVALMNVDDSPKVDTSPVENGTASTADVHFDSKSSLMDVDLDTSNKLDQIPSGGDEMDIDSGNPDPSSLRVNIDESSTSQSDAARHHGEEVGSVSLREATLGEIPSLDCELVSCSNSEEQSSEARSTTRREVQSTEVSSLPPTGTCELANSSCSSSVVLHGNSSDQTVNPLTGFSSGSISKKNNSKPARAQSCSNGKQKPLFSVGFLDKRSKPNPLNRNGTVLTKPGDTVRSNCNVITKPPNRNGTVLAKPGEVGMPSEFSSNCNGITEPALSLDTNAEEHKSISAPGFLDKHGITKPALSQDTNLDHNHNGFFASEHKSIFTPGFLDKHSRCRSQNGNGSAIAKPSHIGVPCKPNGKCNGSTNHSQSIKVIHEDNVSSQNGNGNMLVNHYEVGESCKHDRNCNGFAETVASQSNHMVHDGNSISEYGNGSILIKPEVGASCRLDNDDNGSTELATSAVSAVHHGNGTVDSEHQHSPSRPTFISEVGSSCEAKNLNGSANFSSLQNSTEYHNNDRNFECHIDDDEQEDDKGDACNPSGIKSLKQECLSLSDCHNCNKFPRVG